MATLWCMPATCVHVCMYMPYMVPGEHKTPAVGILPTPQTSKARNNRHASSTLLFPIFAAVPTGMEAAGVGMMGAEVDTIGTVLLAGGIGVTVLRELERAVAPVVGARWAGAGVCSCISGSLQTNMHVDL